MGSNSEGRLGIGDPSVKYSATPCPVELPARLKTSQVSCGASHTVAVAGNISYTSFFRAFLHYLNSIKEIPTIPKAILYSKTNSFL